MALTKGVLLLVLVKVLGIECWKFQHLVNQPCKVTTLSAAGIERAPMLKEVVHRFKDFVYDPIKRINCTQSESIKDFNLGIERNGSYNGIVGELQRGDYDVAFFPIREGSLVDEPVIFGPVMFTSDLAVLSLKRPSREIKVGVEECLHSFDLLIYSYSFLSLVLFVFIYTFLDHFRLFPLGNGKLRSIFSRSLKLNSWKSLLMVINVESMNPTTISATVVFMSFSLFIFYTVNGLFLGSMSADLVKTVELPTIDTLDDLLRHDDFKNISVSCMAGAWQQQGIEAALDGSDVSKLWKTRVSNKFSFSMNDARKLIKVWTEVLRGIISRKGVVIFDSLLINSIVAMGCQSGGLDLGPLYHISSQKFASGILMTGYSPYIRPELRAYFDHAMLKMYETGWFNNYLPSIAFGISLGRYTPYQMLTCIEGWDEADEGPGPEPFNLYYFKNLFLLTISMLIVALVVLLAELIAKAAAVRISRSKMKKYPDDRGVRSYQRHPRIRYSHSDRVLTILR